MSTHINLYEHLANELGALIDARVSLSFSTRIKRLLMPTKAGSFRCGASALHGRRGANPPY